MPEFITADYLTSLDNDRNTLADNLVEMGVEATHSESFTDLAPKVLDIVTGVNLKSITLNQDGTYTLVDDKDVSHTLTVTVDAAGKITSVQYDNDDPVNMTYDASDNLTKIGDTAVDVTNYTPAV